MLVIRGGDTTSEPAPSQLSKLERYKAKTKAQRHKNILAEEAAQICNDKIPVWKKVLILCLLELFIFLITINILYIASVFSKLGGTGFELLMVILLNVDIILVYFLPHDFSFWRVISFA